MALKLGDEFLRDLIDRGLVPDDTICVDIRIRVGDIPMMWVQRMPPAEDIELVIENIKATEEIIPPPPRPKVDKPPGIERRGI